MGRSPLGNLAEDLAAAMLASVVPQEVVGDAEGEPEGGALGVDVLPATEEPEPGLLDDVVGLPGWDAAPCEVPQEPFLKLRPVFLESALRVQCRRLPPLTYLIPYYLLEQFPVTPVTTFFLGGYLRA